MSSSSFSTSPTELLKFFVPLALQAACQSLTYPLVAAVASWGEGGVANLAGLAQSNSVVFLLGTLGAGMTTAGMVYGKSRQGYATFERANLIIGFVVVALQALLCIPPLTHILFSGIMHLPPEIETPARLTLLSTLPLNILFCLRTPYQVILYNGKETGKASFATLSRIALTALLSPVFCLLGLVGPQWAAVCLMIPIAWETALSWHLSRPLRRGLCSVTGRTPAILDILKFNAPLSVGGLFLTLSGMLMGAFIARAADPGRMLPAYYVAIGLANPMAFAAARLQAVVLAYPPHHDRSGQLFRFSVICATAMGCIPLIFLLPGLSTLYYGFVQNVKPGDMPLIVKTASALALYPLAVGLRSYFEGVAACSKKTFTILWGHSAYLGALALTGGLALMAKLPGTVIGPAGLIAANLCAAILLIALLSWVPLRSTNLDAVPD